MVACGVDALLGGHLAAVAFGTAAGVIAAALRLHVGTATIMAGNKEAAGLRALAVASVGTLEEFGLS